MTQRPHRLVTDPAAGPRQRSAKRQRSANQPPLRTMLAVTLLACCLTGCSTIKPVAEVRGALSAGSAPDHRLQSRGLPYAQLALRIGDGAVGRMLLVTMDDGVEEWLSADGKVLWIENGRILATEGLRTDMLRTEALAPWRAPATLAGIKQGYALSTEYYLETEHRAAGRRQRHVLSGALQTDGEVQSIARGDEIVSVQLVRETLSDAASGEQWVNRYWVSRDLGLVEASHQKIPGTDTWLRLELLKAPETPSQSKSDD